MNLLLLGIGSLVFLWMIAYGVYHPDVKKAMMIVEPRKHPDLAHVLQNFDTHMDSSWDLYVFHGASAGSFLDSIVRGLSKSRKVYLIPLSTDNLTANEYNKLFKNESFWNNIDAEDILVFQTDTALCSKSPFRIDRFRRYGYLGCSNKKDSIGFHKQVWAKEFPFYGIGGLSFRKKSFMLNCIRNNPNVDPDYAEDVFYSEHIHKENSSLKPESADVLCDFCTQHYFNSMSFAAHKTKILKPEDKDAFYSLFCCA